MSLISDDDKLIQRYLDGDLEGFTELYRKYRVVLYNFILSMVKDKDLADDIFQETFIRIIEKISSYKEGNFKAYLFKVARNRVIDEMRKRSKENKLILPQPSDEELTEFNIPSKENTQDRLFHQLESERIHQALEKLPPAYKEIIYLKHFAKLTFDEISQLSGIPIGTLLSRFKRAIDKLRLLLRDV